VLWGVFEHVTRDYRDVLDGIEHDIDQIEEELFAEDEGVSRRIFALQREVIDLGHATASLPEVLERIQRIVERKEQIEDAPAFREVAERA
ncbi:CorA family divalent cation transporter, partial [Streptomyces brasiliscabiei]|uniref:CorA family divalent cation transporter n=1 Tax=Streptomyces brasiliscabiei TaxID=2736302 RepID=UPI003015059A